MRSILYIFLTSIIVAHNSGEAAGIPLNAEPDRYATQGWSCIVGFSQNGGDCKSDSNKIKGGVPLVARDIQSKIIDGRFLISDGNRFVMDMTTGLIWTRCPIGMSYRDGGCMGKSMDLSIDKAKEYLRQYLPGQGWRLPSATEFSSLVKCNTRLEGGSRFGAYLKYNSELGLFIGNEESAHPCGAGSGPDSINLNAFPIPGWIVQNNFRSTYWTTTRLQNKETDKILVFDWFAHSNKPYFESLYKGCNTFYGCVSKSFMAVVHETELKGVDLFGFFDRRIIANLPELIPPTILIWKSTDASNVKENKLHLSMPAPSMERLLLFKVHELIAADANSIPPAPSIPDRDEFSADPATTPKGEFETTVAYQDRIKQAQRESEKYEEKKYQEALLSYKLLTKKREHMHAQLSANLATPEYYRQKLLQAWNLLSPAVMGNPTLTDIRYDADRQEYLATLRSPLVSYRMDISASVPLEKAIAIKPDLLSGKIAPKVEFEFPSMSVKWSLVENAALRAKKFEAATTPWEIENLIKEYPDSLETKVAKARVFEVAKNSKEMAAAIERNRTWPEATAAAKLLQQKQDQEFQEARANDSSWSYDKFLENFGGPDTKKLVERAQRARSNAKSREDQQAREAEEQWNRDRPRREARELCRAQVNTCIASCPQTTYHSPEPLCRSRCESVSCN